MANLSIFGTHSDAGKSTLTWVIGRLLQQQGMTVAPFKAQNVSNNALVADDGSEIAVAQHFQATALGVPTSWHNNPVLLKSGRGSAASLIVRGEAVRTQDVRAYYRDIDTLKPIVADAFRALDQEYDVVIAEGAGSPVELNLMDKDLSNLFVASEFVIKIILVADIEKGGVFASIYGVYHLLPEALRRNIIGVVINKFRGDRSLFDEGVQIIEEQFGIPVLGVLPYRPFNLGFEDSQSLMGYTQRCNGDARRIGVIAYPTMSNYTDFEPLLADEGVCVEFIRSSASLRGYDTVILPGSKLVLEDLAWLRAQGLAEQIETLHREGQTEIVGICGGFEMLHEWIEDEAGIESAAGSRVAGLGIIPGGIRFAPDKVLCRDGEQYEIHHGISTTYPEGYRAGKVWGTFAHGVFADAAFVRYRREQIDAFAEAMGAHLDMERIVDALR